MITFKKTLLNCQGNFQTGNKHYVIQCEISNNSPQFAAYLEEARRLSSNVNSGAANNSAAVRDDNRLIQDALGGVLAEAGWINYINATFGNVASPTEFISANGQIDIVLENGERLEVRSSFPRNGVNFAVCNDRNNFKIIGAYNNLYKPREVKKDIYSSVLFDTKKSDLINDSTILFSLIGIATSQMMLDDTSFTDDLVADGDMTAIRTRYRLRYIKDSLDMNGFEEWMVSRGYNKV